MNSAAMRRWVMLWLCAVLAACGGGGGGGGDGSANGSGEFSVRVDASSTTKVTLERALEPLWVTAEVSYTGALSALFLAVEYDTSVLADVQGGTGMNGTLAMSFVPRSDLGPGDHPTEIFLHACLDEDCRVEVAGSPVRVPLVFRVMPNIQVQPQLLLARSGRELAVETVVPVTIPPEAGAVSLDTTTFRPDALSVTFDGTALRVQPREVSAGTYITQARLHSSTDIRYERVVNIEYTVTAPPGGEQPLSVTGPTFTFALAQGTATVQRLVVTRPTWTAAWDAPQVVSDTPSLVGLTDLGNDEYEVVVSTAGLPLGLYTGYVVFSAGATGGSVAAAFSVYVNAGFSVGPDLWMEVSADSTLTDLDKALNITMSDGAPARWTASTTSPWLRIATPSGQAGVDALRLSLDPAFLAVSEWSNSLPLTISVDRPGSLPSTYNLTVSNRIPTLRSASPTVLVGGSGRLYLQGAMQNFLADPLWPSNRLSVTGATLAGASLLADTRFLGEINVLALDVTGAAPGQPITVSLNGGLLPAQSQVQVAVQAPLRASGYQAVPLGSYRPAQYAPSLGALYFAGEGAVYRWAHSGGTWSLSQAAMPGVVDVAPGAMNSVLYANDAQLLWQLDPTSLAATASSALTSWQSSSGFDSAVPGALNGLVFSADGRGIASTAASSNSSVHERATVCADHAGRLPTALIAAPRVCDPGTSPRYEGAQGYGLLRSPNGHAVLAVAPDGKRSRYRAADRQWSEQSVLPAGLSLAAVSDPGDRAVRSDGMLIDASDRLLGDLDAVLPSTHVAGGYGLSASGRYGLVYGYRITGTGAAQRATDATLWVLDLNDAALSGVSAAPVLAAINLPAAMGCTVALVGSETCQHQAAISVAPGDGTAFLVGPRAVAAVALPAGMVAARAPVLRAMSAVREAQSKPAATLPGVAPPANRRQWRKLPAMQ